MAARVATRRECVGGRIIHERAADPALANGDSCVAQPPLTAATPLALLLDWAAHWGISFCTRRPGPGCFYLKILRRCFVPWWVDVFVHPQYRFISGVD